MCTYCYNASYPYALALFWLPWFGSLMCTMYETFEIWSHLNIFQNKNQLDKANKTLIQLKSNLSRTLNIRVSISIDVFGSFTRVANPFWNFVKPIITSTDWISPLNLHSSHALSRTMTKICVEERERARGGITLKATNSSCRFYRSPLKVNQRSRHFNLNEKRQMTDTVDMHKTYA